MADVAAKCIKLDEDAIKLRSRCSILQLPDEIIHSILCLVGTEFGNPNPTDDDWLTETPETNPIDTPMDKFRLFLVNHRFKRLAESPRSWQRNITLYLYPKFNGIVTPSGPNGLRINRQPFSHHEASAALRIFLKVAPIKNLLFYNITKFTEGKCNRMLKKNVFSELKNHQDKLANSVQSLKILGGHIYEDAKEIMSWACRTMVNIQTVYVTFPRWRMMIDQPESFQSELIQSIVVCSSLRRLTLNHFTQKGKLVQIVSGKQVEELNIDMEMADPFETDDFIEIFNSLPDQCLVKFVLDSRESMFIVDLDINRWINSCRPESLESIGHLELNHSCNFPFNLDQSISLLPALSYCKISFDDVIDIEDEVLQMFTLVANLVNLYAIRRPNLRIYLNSTIGGGLFSRNRFQEIQTQSPNHWQGIEIEELPTDEENEMNYLFHKGSTSVHLVVETRDH